MELNTYQKKAMTTCMPSSNNFAYMFFGLLGEVGELIEKVNDKYGDPSLSAVKKELFAFGAIAKKIRKEPDSIIAKRYSDINLVPDVIIKEEGLDGVIGEIGDVEWMLNGLMTVLDVESEYAHNHNLSKLKSRDKRGVIDGDGDNR